MMAGAGILEVCYDGRILSEYKEVLLRPKFAFDKSDVEVLLEQIEFCGCVTTPKPLSHRLPDFNDEPFLEIALGGKARCLITGNLKHYPARARQKIPVINPVHFLTKFYPGHS